jgi:hypothetical protein
VIKIEISRRQATVYDNEGRIVNTGNRPQDYAFARNVANAKGYNRQEEENRGRHTIFLWESV